MYDFGNFIPDRWTLLDSTSGDLNGDNRDDIAFVIESKDSLTTFTHQEQQGEVFVEVNKSETPNSRNLSSMCLDTKKCSDLSLLLSNNSRLNCSSVSR